MTPLEKAEELVLKYLRLQEPNYNWFHKGLAKQCAIIAVDEILITGLLLDSSVYVKVQTSIDYWNEVKEEISKL